MFEHTPGNLRRTRAPCVLDGYERATGKRTLDGLRERAGSTLTRRRRVPIAEPVEHHRSRQEHRRRVGLVESGVLGR